MLSQAIKLPNPPPYVAQNFDAKTYAKAQAYSLDKWWFGFYQSLYSTTENVLSVGFGLIPWVWDLTGSWLQQRGYGSEHEILHTIVFVLTCSAFSMVTGLPWSAYSTFVIEARHGFNRQTPALFVGDLLKSLLLGALLMPPIIGAITYILIHSGPMLPLYLWVFVLALSLIMLTVYPTLIAPIFNKFTSLPQVSTPHADTVVFVFGVRVGIWLWLWLWLWGWGGVVAVPDRCVLSSLQFVLFGASAPCRLRQLYSLCLCSPCAWTPGWILYQF